VDSVREQTRFRRRRRVAGPAHAAAISVGRPAAFGGESRASDAAIATDEEAARLAPGREAVLRDARGELDQRANGEVPSGSLVSQALP
jgi:hypothetical protein